MGLAPTEASECVRFTFGWDTRPQDGDTAAALVAATVGALR